MTGLRVWDRDAELPAFAGDAALVPPSEEDVLALVRHHLLADGAVAPVSAHWTYARWKPGIALSCAYTLELPGGGRPIVVVKRHVGGKAAARPLRVDAASAVAAQVEGLPADAVRPEWTSADHGLSAWWAAADRRLPGVRRIHDLSRLRRLLEAEGTFAGRQVRRRRSSVHWLRYRPERRAVVRIDLSLKDPEGHRSEVRVAARLLPPDVAEAVAGNRRWLGSCPFVPTLLLHEARTGMLLEGWCDVTPLGPTDFRCDAEAGALLARLHRHPAPPPTKSAGDVLVDTPDPLLAWHPELAARWMPRSLPSSGTHCWTHGDFHPDQIGCDASGSPTTLLDLDALRGGDPLADLSSWIADRLAEHPEEDLESAAGPLLEGYRADGGRAVARESLAPWVASQLQRRAAAACRRLQRGAVERARELLDRARELDAPSAASP